MTIKSKSSGKSIASNSAGGGVGSAGTGFVTEHQRIDNLALVARIIEDNPDLFTSFVEEILLGLADAKAGHVSTYDFDTPDEPC